MRSSALRVLRTLRALNEDLRRPPWVAHGHFYSPSASRNDIARALSWPDEAPGVDLRSSQQLDLAVQIAPMLNEAPRDRFRANNNMFGIADAAVLHAMIRHLAPQRIIEVGSGYSTAMLLDTADQAGLDIEITCIEPYPDRLMHILRPHDRVSLVSKPVQEVALSSFTSLEDHDILFIDSTHVAKAGSDVLWLFLHVLPRLRSGVVVHVHDIFWPFEYPETWMREGRDWTEAYLLNAFLCHNNSWDLLFFSSWLWRQHPELLPDGLRGSAPGSFWMQRNTH